MQQRGEDPWILTPLSLCEWKEVIGLTYCTPSACSCLGYIHVPLDGFHAEIAGGENHIVVIFAVGRTEQGGADAGDRLDLIAAGVDVFLHLLLGQLGEVGVVVRVVHDLVPGIMQGLHRFRVFLHPFSHHEKGGLDIILSENADKLLRVFVAPG